MLLLWTNLINRIVCVAVDIQYHELDDAIVQCESSVFTKVSAATMHEVKIICAAGDFLFMSCVILLISTLKMYQEWPDEKHVGVTIFF